MNTTTMRQMTPMWRLRSSVALMGLLLAVTVLGSACEEGGEDPVVGSESHWLEPCEATRDCPSGQSCQCGICTVSCDDDQDCEAGGEGGVCAAHVSLSEECESSLFWAESICVSECADEAACDAIDPQLTCTAGGICEREERRMTPVDAGADTDAMSSDADAADAGQVACEEPVAPLPVDAPVEVDVAVELVDVAGAVTLETATGRYNEDVLPVGQKIRVRQGWAPSSGEPLEIDLEVFEVSGTMAVNGGTLPDASESRGEVRFERRDGQGTSPAVLGRTGDGSYAVKLFAGSYDVRYVQKAATPGLPRGGAHAAEALVVDADGVFDFDVLTTTVDFDVTIDGQPLPDNSTAGSRGAFVLWDRESGLERRIDLGATGPMQTTETLYLQTLYDVYLETGPTSEQNALPADQRVPIESGLGYEPNAVVDVDLGSHALSGEVTVNGAQEQDALPPNVRGAPMGVCR